MILYLMRHAQALSKSEAKVDSDAKRPLSMEGVETARQSARVLKKLVNNNRLRIFSSPLLRAIQTSSLVATDLGDADYMEVLDELDPINAPDVFLNEFFARGLKEDLLAVGHHPHLSNIASELISGEVSQDLSLKPGGILVIEISSYPKRLGCRLVQIISPSV
jgi:phosphohistidine phosphatase